MRRILLIAILVAACRGGDHRDPSAGSLAAEGPASSPTGAPLTTDASPQGTTMSNAKDQPGPLPSPFDLRVTRALEAPLADDVVLTFAHVAMAKSPSTNHRYELHRDGRLFYVQHSGTPGDWQQPFDRPLPAAPARTLAPSEVTALMGAVEAAGFFDHPGYQANPQVEGGSFWLVRARRGADVHTVVYQNTRPEPVGTLAAVSDPLWQQAP